MRQDKPTKINRRNHGVFQCTGRRIHSAGHPLWESGIIAVLKVSAVDFYFDFYKILTNQIRDRSNLSPFMKTWEFLNANFMASLLNCASFLQKRPRLAFGPRLPVAATTGTGPCNIVFLDYAQCRILRLIGQCMLFTLWETTINSKRDCACIWNHWNSTWNPRKDAFNLILPPNPAKQIRSSGTFRPPTLEFPGFQRPQTRRRGTREPLKQLPREQHSVEARVGPGAQSPTPREPILEKQSSLDWMLSYDWAPPEAMFFGWDSHLWGSACFGIKKYREPQLGNPTQMAILQYQPHNGWVIPNDGIIRRPSLQQGERVKGEIASSKGQEDITSSKVWNWKNKSRGKSKKQEARSEEARRRKRRRRSNGEASGKRKESRKQAARTSNKRQRRRKQAGGQDMEEKKQGQEEEARKQEGRGKLQEASGKSKEDMEARKSKIQQQARDGRKLIITARTRKQRGRS